MKSNLKSPIKISFLSSIEDRINAFDLKSPVSLSDDVWMFNTYESGVSTADFTVFDSRQLSWVKSVTIRSDDEQITVSIKTLSKILFIGIHASLTNSYRDITAALHSIKMLFYYLSENRLYQLNVDELERFLCFYLVNDMDGAEMKRVVSPPNYKSRPIITHLRKIRTTLHRYAVEGVLGTFPDSKFFNKMNLACEVMLDMTFSDYKEEGSFNYLGLKIGKHYIDHCHSFFEEHFLFTSALGATIETAYSQQTSRYRAELVSKILLGQNHSSRDGVTKLSLETKLNIEASVHNNFRNAYKKNTMLFLLFKLGSVRHFVKFIGISERYDAQEFVRCLFFVEVFGTQGGKTKKSIWAEYEAAAKVQGEHFSVSLNDFESSLKDFIVSNVPTLPGDQESLRKYLFDKTDYLLDVFSLTREAGKRNLDVICKKVRQVGALCFLGATGWRRSEFDFTFSDIKISNNHDALDNFYTPWRFHIHWLVPKTNGNSKTMREITSATYILLSQIASINNDRPEKPILGNGSFIYEASKLLWSDFIQNYNLFHDEHVDDKEQLQSIDYVKEEVQGAFPIYQLTQSPDGFKNILSQYSSGGISAENRKLLNENLPAKILELLLSPDIELTDKNIAAVKRSLLKEVKYPSPHAFRHIWAEAVLMRYRGPVGSFIRANFQHMDDRFFMAYLRDKDMKLINQNAERAFISWVSQQYADFGRDVFGETVSQLPRFIELLVGNTSVLSHDAYLNKVGSIADSCIESVKANPWGTCIRRSGTDFRAACSKNGVPHTHNASPNLCLSCTNVDITKANLRGIMVYTRQEVEACLNPNLPANLKARYLDTIKRALNVVIKLKGKSSRPSTYYKAIADFEMAQVAASNGKDEQ
jgi:hypothetical protein